MCSKISKNLTFAGVIISDVLDGVPHNLLVVNISLAGDLSTDHDHAGLGDGLAGNLCVRVLLQVSIEDSVGHLVAHFV